MIWDKVNEQYDRVYQASEACQLQVLPGRINASSKLSAVVVASEYRKEGERLRMFVTPVGVLAQPGLVTADGLGLTQECEDLFDELLMHLRSQAGDAQFYETEDGLTLVAFKRHGTRTQPSRPMLLLPWWSTDEVLQAKTTVAQR